MLTLAVLLVAVATVALVISWSGRVGGRNRTGGTSLHRGNHSHVTSRGRPKVAYANREAAEVQARQLSMRHGSSMNVYQCESCAKWHVGHAK